MVNSYKNSAVEKSKGEQMYRDHMSNNIIWTFFKEIAQGTDIY